MQNPIINPWCKLYIVFLVFFQVYLLQWELPSSFPPAIISTTLGGLIVVFSKHPSSLSNIGRFVSIGSIGLQIPFLCFCLFIAFYWEASVTGGKSISFDLLLLAGTIIYLSLGMVLYLRAFWIQPLTHNATKETRVFFIILSVIFLGLLYFKGGPTLNKVEIPAGTHDYLKKEINKLYSRNPVKRAAAAKQLGYFPSLSEPAIPFLISMLGTPGNAASITLGKMGKPAAKHLIKALGNKNPVIRTNAMNALNSKMGSEAQNALLSCLTDEDASIRKKAVYKMEWIYKSSKDPRIVLKLITTLSDKSPDVRIAAARRLHLFKDPRIFEPLISSLDDENKIFRKSVLNTLILVTKQDFDVDRKAWLEWWQDNKRVFIEQHFINERTYFHRIISYSLRHLTDPFDISLLGEALNDQNINVVKSAIWMLGESGSPQAVEPLIEALGNNYKQAVQKLIYSKLFQLTGVNIKTGAGEWKRWWSFNREDFLSDNKKYIREHPEDLIAALQSDSANTFRIALKLGEPAVIPMIKALINGNVETRKIAAAKLGFMKDPRAIKPLINTLFSEKGLRESYSIRNSAMLSLMSLTDQELGDNPKAWQEWWDKSEFGAFLRDNIDTCGSALDSHLRLPRLEVGPR